MPVLPVGLRRGRRAPSLGGPGSGRAAARNEGLCGRPGRWGLARAGLPRCRLVPFFHGFLSVRETVVPLERGATGLGGLGLAVAPLQSLLLV